MALKPTQALPTNHVYPSKVIVVKFNKRKTTRNPQNGPHKAKGTRRCLQPNTNKEKDYGVPLLPSIDKNPCETTPILYHPIFLCIASAFAQPPEQSSPRRRGVISCYRCRVIFPNVAAPTPRSKTQPPVAYRTLRSESINRRRRHGQDKL